MIERYEPSEYMDKDEYGLYIKLLDCIVLEQDNMILGDSIDGVNELNGQMRAKADMDKVYDVMIIMKEVKK